MNTEHKSICAYDPGLTTGMAELQFDDSLHFGDATKLTFDSDCNPFTHYAICETSSGKDGITSAYMRGYIQGKGDFVVWIEQAPAERRRFIPQALSIVHKWCKERSVKVSDHMIDACAHLLCFLHKYDQERYDKVTKGVN